MRELLIEIGEDPTREGLLDTPKRVAKALEFLTSGYRTDAKQLINGACFTQETSSMVIVKDIEVYSMCEHHMLPFFGRCHIGYIPSGTVFGVSKLARLVDMYARRLQLQERLTEQISNVVMESVNAKGVGVMIEARHLCMMMRGVEKQNSTMVTSSVLGEFRDSLATREEFFSLDRAPRLNHTQIDNPRGRPSSSAAIAVLFLGRLASSLSSGGSNCPRPNPCCVHPERQAPDPDSSTAAVLPPRLAAVSTLGNRASTLPPGQISLAAFCSVNSVTFRSRCARWFLAELREPVLLRQNHGRGEQCAQTDNPAARKTAPGRICHTNWRRYGAGEHPERDKQQNDAGEKPSRLIERLMRSRIRCQRADLPLFTRMEPR